MGFQVGPAGAGTSRAGDLGGGLAGPSTLGGSASASGALAFGSPLCFDGVFRGGLRLVGPGAAIGNVVIAAVVIAAMVFDGTAGEVVDQLGRHRSVPQVGRADRCVGDDLRVGIHCDRTLVASKAPSRGLMPMPGLGVGGGDHLVGGDPAGDTESAVVCGLEVLAQHRRQQLDRLGEPAFQFASSK